MSTYLLTYIPTCTSVVHEGGGRATTHDPRRRYVRAQIAARPTRSARHHFLDLLRLNRLVPPTCM